MKPGNCPADDTAVPSGGRSRVAPPKLLCDPVISCTNIQVGRGEVRPGRAGAAWVGAARTSAAHGYPRRGGAASFAAHAVREEGGGGRGHRGASCGPLISGSSGKGRNGHHGLISTIVSVLSLQHPCLSTLASAQSLCHRRDHRYGQLGAWLNVVATTESATGGRNHVFSWQGPRRGPRQLECGAGSRLGGPKRAE